MTGEAATRPWRDRLAALRLRPYEIFSYGAAALTLVFLRSRGLGIGWNTVEVTLLALVYRIPLLLLVGVSLRAIAVWISGEDVRGYLREVARPTWLGSWLRLIGAFVAYIYAYLWLKVSIPLLRSDLYDIQVWSLDRWLHFGVSPTVFAIELVSGTPLVGVIDVFYSYWIFVIPVWTAYVYAARRDAARRQFALAVALLWVAGSWIYYFIPAVGPCFWSEDFLAPIREQMPLVGYTQSMLWDQYRSLAGRGDATMHLLSPALGVAAMPSLHVGAYVLFALWSRRHARRWFRLWVLASVLVFFGSLATAWHYAVDGYVGALLAWLSVRVADRLEPAREASREVPGSHLEVAAGAAAAGPSGRIPAS